jgi:outer membrane immunogenic protein
MRKLLLSGAALAVIAGPAFAADLAVRPIYKAPPPMVPVYSWTGFYGGVNIGYSWGRSSTDVAVAGLGTISENQNIEGVVGGFQWGYNWQFGNYVLGTESDFMFSGERGSTTYCAGLAACVTANHRLPWESTSRMRLGVLVTPTVLLYGTAGVAFGQVRSDYTVATGATLSMRDTRAGWTAGGGIEGMVAPNWTLRAEALYIDLGNQRTSLVDATGASVLTVNRRVNDTIARIGASYKFF